MPITRRKRATPPEQPENTNHVAAPTEADATQSTPTTPVTSEAAPATENPTVKSPTEPSAASSASASPITESAANANAATPVPPAPSPMSNGDRSEMPVPSTQSAPVAQGYTPTIEGGRRTARGELFRRPPQIPPSQQVPSQQSQQSQPVSASSQPAQLQPPTHEISLPLGNLLHLAYNPGYTGSDEARSALLHKLESESKAGGRARCWNCGSIAIVYDRWSTRSKTFGDVGVAFCEICGVWSVL